MSTVLQNRRPWDHLVPSEEQELYELTGFGRPAGFGKRPALLIIDVQYRSIGDSPMPIRESIQRYPTSCGEAGWHAVTHIQRLVEACRRYGFPIFYPHVAKKAEHDRGQFGDKAPAVMGIPDSGYNFVEEIAPQPGDILIPKFHPSAFFGTSLSSYLIGMNVDSVIVTGGTTSGCVRGSAVDACSLNFKTLVPEDAVYDRSPTAHALNLFDMASKYADVMPTTDVLALLDEIGQSKRIDA